MFPLKDINPSRTFPITNYLFIAANAVFFFYQISLSPEQLNEFLYAYAVVPQNFLLLKDTSAWSLQIFISLISSVFLHAGWLHFLLNMWVLQIFGNNVEDSMGHIRYFIFYILGGIIGNITHVFFFTNSTTPLLGASGAIASVMAAYLFLFPSSKVLTLIPILIFPLFIHLYSFVFIAIWFAIQLFGGIAELSQKQSGGVAFWAHIGGFVWGAIAFRFFLLPYSKRKIFIP